MNCSFSNKSSVLNIWVISNPFTDNKFNKNTIGSHVYPCSETSMVSCLQKKCPKRLSKSSTYLPYLVSPPSTSILCGSHSGTCPPILQMYCTWALFMQCPQLKLPCPAAPPPLLHNGWNFFSTLEGKHLARTPLHWFLSPPTPSPKWN